MSTYQPKPSIQSRGFWNAESANPGSQRTGFDYIVVHHCSAPESTINNYTEAQRTYQIQDFHMNTRGYSDIGYHFLVGKNGTIMEGTDIDTRMYSAGDTSKNKSTIHVNLHGNFETRLFDGSQKSKLIDLLSWLCYNYGISSADIYEHNQFSSNTCPGAKVKSALPSIKDEITTRLAGNNTPS